MYYEKNKNMTHTNNYEDIPCFTCKYVERRLHQHPCSIGYMQLRVFKECFFWKKRRSKLMKRLFDKWMKKIRRTKNGQHV